MLVEQFRRPGRCKARFVRRMHNSPLYKWCEQNADKPRYDLAHGTCEAEDLPEEIRKKCDEYQGAFYACEWPF